jgi:SAM-dependent methyltransferase
MIIQSCRVCGGSLEPIISLGKIPIVNYFPDAEEIKTEKKYPLDVYVCSNCSLVQLGYIVPPIKVFKNSHFLTSAAPPLVEYLDKFASTLIRSSGLKKGSRILDIGANDGNLLASFKKRGFDGLGVEPSKLAADLARKKGMPILNSFFNFALSEKVLASYGKFDVITATRVLANIVDLNDFMAGVKNLLADRGIFAVEVDAFDELSQNGEFDTFYHEHYSYFTPESLNYLFRRNGLKIILSERTPFRGGELRIFAVKDGGGIPIFKVPNLNDYKAFARKIVDYKVEANALFSKIKGAKIAGFGAPAKGVTYLNYIGLDERTVSYVVDDTPGKQGRLIPGMHIPVYPENRLTAERPDYCLLLAWNYQDQILGRVRSLLPTKSKIIMPFPKLEVFSV